MFSGRNGGAGGAVSGAVVAGAGAAAGAGKGRTASLKKFDAPPAAFAPAMVTWGKWYANPHECLFRSLLDCYGYNVELRVDLQAALRLMKQEEAVARSGGEMARPYRMALYALMGRTVVGVLRVCPTELHALEYVADREADRMPGNAGKVVREEVARAHAAIEEHKARMRLVLTDLAALPPRYRLDGSTCFPGGQIFQESAAHYTKTANAAAIKEHKARMRLVPAELAALPPRYCRPTA